MSVPHLSSDGARLLAGIRDANYHQGGIRCLQLMRLEAAYFEQLRAEIERLVTTEDGSDVTGPGHITNWTRPRGDVAQFSLVNTTGRFDDFSTDHNLSSAGKRFHAQARYPALARFIGALTETVNVRVNVLGPGARLGAHEEHSIVRTADGRVAARVRFHLPVITNSRAELVLDGAAYHLLARVVYFVNHGCVHAARNLGNAPRIHLVWDSLLTCAAFDRMFGCSALSVPVEYFEADQRSPRPTRTERGEAHVALPTTVSREEASEIGFW
jgi:Aspartyl/Asparaginyl beta-hydroxylase